MCVGETDIRISYYIDICTYTYKSTFMSTRILRTEVNLHMRKGAADISQGVFCGSIY